MQKSVAPTGSKITLQAVIKCFQLQFVHSHIIFSVDLSNITVVHEQHKKDRVGSLYIYCAAFLFDHVLSTVVFLLADVYHMDILLVSLTFIMCCFVYTTGTYQ